MSQLVRYTVCPLAVFYLSIYLSIYILSLAWRIFLPLA